MGRFLPTPEVLIWYLWDAGTSVQVSLLPSFHSFLWYLILSWLHKGAHPLPCSGAVFPSPPRYSLKDSTLLQAVLATIAHGCVVHSLNGPVNCLEDILLHALRVGGQLDLGAKWG